MKLPPHDPGESGSLARPDLRILQSLRRIIQAVEVHSHHLAAKYDITSPQLVCLQAVYEGQPLTATLIAHQVRLSPSTVVGILDRLEKKGLIQRQRDARDRRLVNVTTTEAGRRLAAQAPSPLPDRLAVALGQLSPLEQTAIALSLEQVAELMDPQVAETRPVQRAESSSPSM